MSIKFYWYPFLFFVCLFVNRVSARTIEFSVLNEINNTVIPYPRFTIENQSWIGNAQGKIKLEVPDTAFSIFISHYQYRTQEMVVVQDTLNSYLTVRMTLIRMYTSDTLNSATSIEVIHNMLQYSKLNQYGYCGEERKKSYTKLLINSEKPDLLNGLWVKALGVFGVKSNKLFSDQHHFFLMESNSIIRNKSKHQRKEIYSAIKSTGLSLPAFFVQSSQEYLPNPYQHLIIIKNKEYVSPISHSAIRRYTYQIIDTFYINESPFITITFAPKPKANFNALYGFMIVSLKNYAISNMVFYPAFDVKSFKEYCLSYDENHTVDNYTTRMSDASPLFNNKKTFFIESSTHFMIDTTNFEFDKFNEYVVEIDDSVMYYQSNLPIHRSMSLNKVDSLTYDYYDKVKYARFIQNTLTVGENLYYGYIPLFKTSLETNKLLNLNGVEGLRIGLGGTTNENFSKRIRIYGFGAFGLSDQKFKYGVGSNVTVYKKLDWRVGAEYVYQLTESGSNEQYFTTSVFSSEKLRKYQLSIMDYNETFSIYSTLHPYKNIDLHVSHDFTTLQPSYTYIYGGELIDKMRFSLIHIDARIAPFEKYIRISDKKVPLKSYYPIAYVAFTRSYTNSDLNSGYEFYKFDFRIDQAIRIYDVGTLNLQFIFGGTYGDAPYAFLFNGKGSLKSPSVVMHNSFETMGYNEFLSDHYYALFMSHNFGRIYYRSKYFKPSIMVLYNTGFGSLNASKSHQGINYKTMEKKYSEVGMLLNDIISLKLAGLKVGFGGGLFLRIGDYQYQELNKNLVWKFAINFNI